MKLNLLIGLCIVIHLTIPFAYSQRKGWGLAQLFRAISRGSKGAHISRGPSFSSHGASHSSHGSSHSSHGSSSSHYSGTVSRPIGWDIPSRSGSGLNTDFAHSSSAYPFHPSAPSLPTGAYSLAPNYGRQGFPGYSSAPVSHYNPPVGAFIKPQKVYIQSGQASRPSSGQLAKEAAIYAVIDTSVQASIYSMPLPRVHHHPYKGHGSNGTSVTDKTSSTSQQPDDDTDTDIAIINGVEIPFVHDPSSPTLELTFNTPSGFKVYEHELLKLTERLLSKDANNVYKKRFITMRLQETIVDENPEDNPMYNLLTVKNLGVEDMMNLSVLDVNAVLKMGRRISNRMVNASSTDIEAWKIPTIKALFPLYDNYLLDVTQNEFVTEQQKNEEDKFIDAIIETNVMKKTMKFLVRKGFVKNNTLSFKNELKTMWFTRFGRAPGVSGSSGFEYVFLSERINNTIIGLHNWIYYAKKEEKHELNYLGFIGHIPLKNKGAFVKVRSRLNGILNEATTLFVGFSPELEMSLYTLCYYISPGYQCPIKLAGYDFNILVQRHRTDHGDVLVSADTEFTML